jgi:hypothetical protein
VTRRPLILQLIYTSKEDSTSNGYFGLDENGIYLLVLLKFFAKKNKK